jgi:hypothetical protein
MTFRFDRFIASTAEAGRDTVMTLSIASLSSSTRPPISIGESCATARQLGFTAAPACVVLHSSKACATNDAVIRTRLDGDEQDR